nr:MAG TPA: hypothetical protein [Crassvirales sp.]
MFFLFISIIMFLSKICIPLHCKLTKITIL